MSIPSSSISTTTPASATAGLPAVDAGLPSEETPEGPLQRRIRPYRSLVAKGAMLLVIFLVVPVILYTQFRAADIEKQQLLLRSVRDQGRVMSQALLPLLTASDRPALPQLQRELARFSDDVTNVKLLFKPANAPGFFYIASWPAVPSAHLDIEREKLQQQGVLDRLGETCEGELPVGIRYATPSGGNEVVTSVTPMRAASGCWAVVTSFSASAMPGSNLGVPYWATTEVKVAAVVYFAMAFLVLTTFWSVRRGLRRFAERARAIRGRGTSAGSFGAQNEMPELAAVAEEFDRMVEVLQDSAEDLRRAAEDNAHAFKTPIAVIRQSLEPLKRSVGIENQRAVRAIGLIESSLDKLDGLVASSRRLDEATADLIDTRRTEIDLSDLLGRLLEAHADVLAKKRLVLRGQISPGILVRGDEEMLETVLENIVDNAISFSPVGEAIGVRLEARNGTAELLVGDAGPGVKDENLPRIFERYFSSRPAGSGGEDGASHFGIGLWIARRNIAAMGGTITAENRKPNGLLIRIALPLAGTARLTTAAARPALRLS